MAKEMNMDTLTKKLKTVSNTQDSIPMLSLWIIHHKSHHKKIVETWLDMLKKSKNQHRLTLLYLCNDVVQNCVRKKAPVYKDSFSDVLAEAVTHLRDSAIKGNVQRVVKIWAKRAIYDTDFTDQLLAALITNQAPEKLRNKLLIEYKTSTLIDEIKKFKVIEDGIEYDQKRLKAIKMDVSNTDAIRKLKDKIGGEKFSSDFEDSASQLESFLSRYESYIEERKNVLDLLDHGTVYYHAQYHEAKIVVNAYKNFESRVKKMKKGVDKVKSKFSPLPQESRQNDNSGEDMDVSDDDKDNERKSILFASEPKSKKIAEKVSDKPTNLQPGDAANVLKLLATGLESLKSTNTAESLKKVVSGLVSRPGMRGASFNNTTEPAANENAKGPLFIVKSISSDTSGGNIARTISTVPSPLAGGESPPSPTGSPELNISSPPRLQSLDSRLADLFSGESHQEANRQTADESDSGSDTELISRANRVVDTHVTNSKEDNVLPGLGDLDQVTVSLSNDVKHTVTQSQTLGVIRASGQLPASVNEVNVAATKADVSYAQQSNASTALFSLFSSANQTIPVIGGLSRVETPVVDGSSTPTLDEEPYHPPPSSKSYTPSSVVASSAPAPSYRSDALNFLSKIMGGSTKTSDLIKTGTNLLPTPVPTASTNVTSQLQTSTNTAYGSFVAPPPVWPPTNTHVIASTVSTQMWSSPPPLPSLPPPPVFSWPPNPDTPLPSPWSLTASSPHLPPPNSDSQRHSPPQSNNAYLNSVERTTLPPPPNLEPPLNLPPMSQPQLPYLNEPPVKKGKWDLKDTDYRSISAIERTQSSEMRNNLITLSSPAETRDIRRPPVKPPNHTLTSPNRMPPRDIDVFPVRRSNSDGNAATFAGHQHANTENSVPKRYDQSGRPIVPLEVATIHRRIEEARINSSFDARRPEQANRHEDLHRSNIGQNKPRPRMSEPRPNYRPPVSPRMLPPARRRSVNEMVNIEMEMIRNEKRREEELLRDVALLDQIDRMVPHPRPWTHQRPRLSHHRPPIPRPRLIRHSLVRSARPPPSRMRF